jgi:hypothetical protein
MLDGVAPRLMKKPLANTLSYLAFEYLEGKKKRRGEV